MAAKTRPRAPGLGLEVDLHDLPGGVAAHHDVEEHGVGGENLQQRRVIEEGDIDSAGIVRYPPGRKYQPTVRKPGNAERGTDQDEIKPRTSPVNRA